MLIRACDWATNQLGQTAKQTIVFLSVHHCKPVWADKLQNSKTISKKTGNYSSAVRMFSMIYCITHCLTFLAEYKIGQDAVRMWL